MNATRIKGRLAQVHLMQSNPKNQATTVQAIERALVSGPITRAEAECLCRALNVDPAKVPYVQVLQ